MIRGTAVNQDGRSNGLTAPNGPAQEAVIRAALAAAGVDAARGRLRRGPRHRHAARRSDRGAGARRRAGRGARRRASPSLVGSVKTNIGHLEAAAGIAGPDQGRARAAARRDPAAACTSRRPTRTSRGRAARAGRRPTPMPGPRATAGASAGVSSFGFSGTNAHVVLEAAAETAATPAEPERPLHVLALSARSEAALRQLAARLAAQLDARPGAGRRRRLLHRGRGPCPVRPTESRWPCARWTRRARGWPRSAAASTAGHGDPRPCSATAAAPGVPLHRPGRAVRGDGPRALRDPADASAPRSTVRRGSLRPHLDVAAARGALSRDRGTPGARSTRPHTRSPPCSRSSTRWPSCGGPGASRPARAWATASASTWRRASRACSASRTAAAGRRARPADAGAARGRQMVAVFAPEDARGRRAGGRGRARRHRRRQRAGARRAVRRARTRWPPWWRG